MKVLAHEENRTRQRKFKKLSAELTLALTNISVRTLSLDWSPGIAGPEPCQDLAQNPRSHNQSVFTWLWTSHLRGFLSRLRAPSSQETITDGFSTVGWLWTLPATPGHFAHKKIRSLSPSWIIDLLKRKSRLFLTNSANWAAIRTAATSISTAAISFIGATWDVASSKVKPSSVDKLTDRKHFKELHPIT